MTKEDAQHHAAAWLNVLTITRENRRNWHQTGDEFGRCTQVMLLADAVSQGYSRLAESLPEGEPK